METERYIVNFYSVGDKQFGITDVKKLWITAALVEEAGCGVFINGVIESMELICDTKGSYSELHQLYCKRYSEVCSLFQR